MSRPPPTVVDPARDEDARMVRTGLAFLLAPGIASVVGGVFLVPVLVGGHAEFGLLVASTLLFALVSYPTALILAAPVYLALPQSARRGAVIVPLAGGLAAAPWALASAASQGAGPEYVAAVIAFGLGGVGGLAFVLIRDGLSEGGLQ